MAQKYALSYRLQNYYHSRNPTSPYVTKIDTIVK